MKFETAKRFDEYLSAHSTGEGVTITVNKPRHYCYSIGIDMTEARRLRDALTEALDGVA